MHWQTKGCAYYALHTRAFIFMYICMYKQVAISFLTHYNYHSTITIMSPQERSECQANIHAYIHTYVEWMEMASNHYMYTHTHTSISTRCLRNSQVGWWLAHTSSQMWNWLYTHTHAHMYIYMRLYAHPFAIFKRLTPRSFYNDFQLKWLQTFIILLLLQYKRLKFFPNK